MGSSNSMSTLLDCNVCKCNWLSSTCQHPVSLSIWGKRSERFRCSVYAMRPSACKTIWVESSPTTPDCLCVFNQLPTNGELASAATHEGRCARSESDLLGAVVQAAKKSKPSKAKHCTAGQANTPKIRRVLSIEETLAKAREPALE